MKKLVKEIYRFIVPKQIREFRVKLCDDLLRWKYIKRQPKQYEKIILRIKK